jgi:deazaflavin-dependent oxidoreductase (nitroreductase family)
VAIPLSGKILGGFLRVHQIVYEWTDGRVGASLVGRPMLLLRTTGRRSGKARVAALLYVRDGEDYVVIASTGGRDAHPGWYFNLADGAPAEIQIGRERTAVTASDASGERRKRLWAEADRVNKGGYSRYQSNTDREIPVVVLSPSGRE